MRGLGVEGVTVPEPLDDEETLKWCEGCPLNTGEYEEGCEDYNRCWPRWDGEHCPAREAAERSVQE